MRPMYLDLHKSKTQYVRQIDYIVLVLVLALSTIGILVLASALANRDGGNEMLTKQIVFMFVGFFIAVLLARFDYNEYKVLGFLLYMLSTFLLLLVKIMPTTSFGSSSWLQLPIIGRFQPSEIAKITFIMVVSVFLARLRDGEGKALTNIIKLVVYSAIPIIFIADQPDYGTAMVFVFIIIAILYIFGVKLRFFLFALLGSIPILAGLWFFIFNDQRRGRILTFLNIGSANSDAAYQIKRSITTIGSGQFGGKGLFTGALTQKGVVPINESDFIFTVVGEELGFIGSVFVITLFVLLLIRCIYVAYYARDTYGTLLVTGITGMIGFHFFQNIGMSIGIMPVTGIPLPFFSLGNSAMLTNFIAVGIILSVSMRKRRAS